GRKVKAFSLLSTATSVCAVTPLELWTERNQREAQFNGLSDVAGTTAWRYLAARVRAEANGQNRHRISELAYQEIAIGAYRARKLTTSVGCEQKLFSENIRS